MTLLICVNESHIFCSENNENELWTEAIHFGKLIEDTIVNFEISQPDILKDLSIYNEGNYLKSMPNDTIHKYFKYYNALLGVGDRPGQTETNIQWFL